MIPIKRLPEPTVLAENHDKWLANEAEKELLQSFRQRDQPFSLMFAVYTRDLDV